MDILDWTCPECGNVARVPQAAPKVHCRCGALVSSQGEILRQKTLHWQWGDAVAKVTKAVGVKPCGGCNRRRRSLNRLGDKLHRMLTGG